jgi:DNA-binding MarR family transcriptional regulator
MFASAIGGTVAGTEREHGGIHEYAPADVVVLLRQLARSTQDLLAERAKQAHLNTTDLIALIRIADSPGMGGAQLAQMLGMRSSSITELADRLESAGLIRRAPDPGDRRRVLLRGTARGRRTVERAVGPVLFGLMDLVEELDEDTRAAVTDFLLGVAEVLARPAGSGRASS